MRRRRYTGRRVMTALALTIAVPQTIESQTRPAQHNRLAYGGDGGGMRYAPLTDINRDDVSQLALAWTYRTGELGQDAKDAQKLSCEATSRVRSTSARPSKG